MYKQYEEMKDSGVPWLGEIPSHWSSIKLKNFKKGALIYGLNEAAEDDNREDVRFIRITDLTKMGELKEDTFKSVPMKIANKYLLQEGDILLARSGSVGRSFVYKKEYGDCCYAGYLIKMTPNTELILPQFFKYFTEHKGYYNWIKSISTETTIENVNAEKYSNLPVSLPSLCEQKSIVSYLNQKTAKIDTLIEKKESLIKLLKEKRQVLINETVTKGLNPNVKMKDSGIEWIGEIPEHWEVTSLKRRIRVQSGEIFDANNIKDVGYPIYGGNGVRGYSEEYNASGPMILIGRVGAKCGNVHISNGNFWATEHAFKVKIHTKTDLNYLAYIIETSGLNNQAITTAQPLINTEIVHNNIVCFPPFEEQQQISNYIEMATQRIDLILEKLEEQKKNLKEYRQILIFNAVTGKIDVR